MRQFLAFLLALSVAVPALACEWDYDTLKMERERFPGALELIVGKFLRHSDTFYKWRVEDRTAKIARHESGEATLSDRDFAAAYDDLAVAYDKLGQQDDAIKNIREKADKLPNIGNYETHANLGTFLVHSGKYEEGLAELRNALEINPDAHFGREEYQILLVEYVIEKGSDEAQKPAVPLDASNRSEYQPFADWLYAKRNLLDSDGYRKNGPALTEEHSKALKGLFGMMRFGNFRSPVLLEAVGDMLAASPENDGYADAKQLAARAYLRAASATTGRTSKEYHRFAEEVLLFQGLEPGNHNDAMPISKIEDQLAREVKEADAWFKEVAHDEELWVEASPDPDKRFWEKYGNQTITVGHDRLPAGKFAAQGLSVVMRIALGAGLALTVLIVIGAMIWRKRRPTGYPAGERQV
jgi:tetratricopeptide (TPR) repeat protein